MAYCPILSNDYWLTKGRYQPERKHIPGIEQRVTGSPIAGQPAIGSSTHQYKSSFPEIESQFSQDEFKNLPAPIRDLAIDVVGQLRIHLRNLSVSAVHLDSDEDLGLASLAIYLPAYTLKIRLWVSISRAGASASLFVDDHRWHIDDLGPAELHKLSRKLERIILG